MDGADLYVPSIHREISVLLEGETDSTILALDYIADEILGVLTDKLYEDHAKMRGTHVYIRKMVYYSAEHGRSLLTVDYFDTKNGPQTQQLLPQVNVMIPIGKIKRHPDRLREMLAPLEKELGCCAALTRDCG